MPGGEKPDGYPLDPFAGTTVAGHAVAVQNTASRRPRRVDCSRRNHQQPRLHARGRPPEPRYMSVADLTAAMKKKGAERRSTGRRRSPASCAWGSLPGHRRRARSGRGAVQKRAQIRFNELLSGKPFGAGYATTDLRACAAARRAPAHPRGLDRKAAAIGAGIPSMAESGVPMNLDLRWGVMLAAGRRSLSSTRSTLVLRDRRTEEIRNSRPVGRRTDDPDTPRGGGDVPKGGPGMGRVCGIASSRRPKSIARLFRLPAAPAPAREAPDPCGLGLRSRDCALPTRSFFPIQAGKDMPMKRLFTMPSLPQRR